MSRNRSLSDNQIREIVRLRQAGREHKQIALMLGCTVEQVVHYWRTSPFYRGSKNRETLAMKRRVAGMSAANLKRIRDAEMAASVAWLANEIALAKAERAISPPFKGDGRLTW
jgi:hypothetical protein